MGTIPREVEKSLTEVQLKQHVHEVGVARTVALARKADRPIPAAEEDLSRQESARSSLPHSDREQGRSLTVPLQSQESALSVQLPALFTDTEQGHSREDVPRDLNDDVRDDHHRPVVHTRRSLASLVEGSQTNELGLELLGQRSG
jgi:hypothetical protein